MCHLYIRMRTSIVISMALSGMFLLPLDSGIVTVFIDVSINCCVGLLVLGLISSVSVDSGLYAFVVCVGFTDREFVGAMLDPGEGDWVVDYRVRTSYVSDFGCKLKVVKNNNQSTTRYSLPHLSTV